MNRRSDLIVLLVLLLVLIVGGYFLASPPARDESKVPSTYNADPGGVKAIYTLLGARLGYNVSRLESSYGRMPGKARVLVVLEPDVYPGIGPSESKALARWVRRGGTLIYASESFIGPPLGLERRGKMGKGFVCLYRSPVLFTNKSMRDYRNALRVIRLIDARASRSDLVLFDEYHHGHTGGESDFVLSGPVKACFWMLAAGAVLLAYSRGRRFGMVRSLPRSETVRPGFEFVEAVGRLYKRAGAADLAARILCDSLRQELCSKLGLAHDAPAEAIAERLEPAVGQRVEGLLRQCEQAAGQKLSGQELVRVAREIHEIEKELRLGTA